MKLSFCPLCQSTTLRSWFSIEHSTIVRCTECSLVMSNPQPDDGMLRKIYDASYFIGSDTDVLRDQSNKLKRGTARLQLADISSYLGIDKIAQAHPQLLEIGCGLGNFLVEARQLGFDVHGVDLSESAVATANAALGEERAQAGQVEELGFTKHSFDIVVLADVIEHVRDPIDFLKYVQGLIKPGGILFMAIPSLDSLSARAMGRYWVEFKLEHLYYFNRETLTRLMDVCGFEDIALTPGRKMLSLDYIIAHFEQFPVPILIYLMRGLSRVLPKRCLSHPMRIVASGINAIARAPKT